LVLSLIVGLEVSTALVRRILDEANSEVRSVMFDHLKQREEAGVVGLFARALGSEAIPVINRAAWALGNLNAVEAVPGLISVLITTQQRIVYEPPPSAAAAGPAIPALGPGPTLK